MIQNLVPNKCHAVVLLPASSICKVYYSHINELNEHISNERKLVKKIKFVRSKLPIYQCTKLGTKSMQRQCDLI